MKLFNFRERILRWMFPKLETEQVRKLLSKKKKEIKVIEPYDLEIQQEKDLKEKKKRENLPHPIN